MEFLKSIFRFLVLAYICFLLLSKDYPCCSLYLVSYISCLWSIPMRKGQHFRMLKKPFKLTSLRWCLAIKKLIPISTSSWRIKYLLLFPIYSQFWYSLLFAFIGVDSVKNVWQSWRRSSSISVIWPFKWLTFLKK